MEHVIRVHSIMLRLAAHGHSDGDDESNSRDGEACVAALLFVPPSKLFHLSRDHGPITWIFARLECVVFNPGDAHAQRLQQCLPDEAMLSSCDTKHAAASILFRALPSHLKATPRPPTHHYQPQILTTP